MMPYTPSPSSIAARAAFATGEQTVGFDGISDDPVQRGVDGVLAYTRELVLAALIEGFLDADPSLTRDEIRRQLAGRFMSGMAKIDPLDFVAPSLQPARRRVVDGLMESVLV